MGKGEIAVEGGEESLPFLYRSIQGALRVCACGVVVLYSKRRTVLIGRRRLFTTMGRGSPNPTDLSPGEIKERQRRGWDEDGSGLTRAIKFEFECPFFLFLSSAGAFPLSLYSPSSSLSSHAPSVYASSTAARKGLYPTLPKHRRITAS